MSIKGIVEPEVLTSAWSGLLDDEQAAFATRLDGDAILVCSGELDPATNPALRLSLHRLSRLEPDRVVIDLRRVSFFDAGAIGEFVRARNASRAAGGDLVVRDPTPFGRRVLSIVGLTNLIDTTGGLESSDNESAGVSSHGADVVDAWATACATPRYGATSLGFDPVAMVAAITVLIDDPASDDHFAADLSSAAVERDEMSSATAVLQLWALLDVLYAWIERNRGPTLGSESDQRHRVELENALAGMASSAIAELADRFTAANRSGVVIEEAKGLIAGHFDIGIDEASSLLRAFATAQNQPTHIAAVALMNRTIAVSRLAPHRPGRAAAAERDTDHVAHGCISPGGG